MTRSDYDQWAEAYATANAEGFFNAWYEKPAMLGLLGDVSGHRILDAGCGSGPTSAALTGRGAQISGFDLSAALTGRGAQISGFDLSAAMIDIARRNLPETDLRVHDLAEPLPWEAHTFDTVVASLALHYLHDWSRPLAELHRVLTSGGRLLVSVNHPGAFPIVQPDLEYFGITEYTEDYDFAGTSVDLTFFHRPSRNGTLVVPVQTVTISPEDAAAQFECPNPNWREEFTGFSDLSYTYSLTFAGFTAPAILVTG